MAKKDEEAAVVAAALLAASGGKGKGEPPSAPPGQDKQTTESLVDYVTRIEALADTERIRIHPDYIDEDAGVLLVKPVLLWGVDDTGTPVDIVDNNTGQLKAGAWPEGTHYTTAGTITFNAAGTGAIDMAMTSDAVLLWGYIQMGATRAGGADEVRIYHIDSGGYLVKNYGKLDLNASENYYFPTVAGGTNAKNGIHGDTGYGNFMLNTDSLAFYIDGVANAETAVCSLTYITKDSAEATVSATKGAWSAR